MTDFKKIIDDRLEECKEDIDEDFLECTPWAINKMDYLLSKIEKRVDFPLTSICISSHGIGDIRAYLFSRNESGKSTVLISLGPKRDSFHHGYFSRSGGKCTFSKFAFDTCEGKLSENEFIKFIAKSLNELN